MTFFQDIGNMIDDFFNLIENSANSDLVTQLSILFSITLTITVLIKGFAVLAGKTQDPIRELVWDMTLKVMIITFALNIGGWLDLVTNAMQGLHEWAGAGTTPYAQLDNLYTKTKELASIAYDKSDFFTGGLSAIIIYASFILGAVPALMTLIVTSLTLKILVMLAPFMFFALIYGWLKNMFTQWLSLFFANTLTVLVISLILSAVLNKFSYFIDYSKAGMASGADSLYIASQFLIVGYVFLVLIMVSKGIAEKIATVSMESLMQSSFGRTIDPLKRFVNRKK